MTRTSRPSPRLPIVGACLGLLVTLGACGNGGANSDTPTASVSASSSSTSVSASTMPGATLTLRQACVTTNDEIAAANDAWNAAVDSHKDADLKKATSTMTSLASTLRSAGTDAHDATFKTDADKVATQVDALTKAEKPAKTVDTTTYNDTVDSLTTYCSSMFPKPSSSGAPAASSAPSAS